LALYKVQKELKKYKRTCILPLELILGFYKS